MDLIRSIQSCELQWEEIDVATSLRKIDTKQKMDKDTHNYQLYQIAVWHNSEV